MSVHQTPSGNWFLKYYVTVDGKRKEKREYYGRDGKNTAIEINHFLGLGKPHRATGPTFTKLVNDWLRAKKNTLSKSTLIVCGYRFENQILPELGNKQAITLTAPVIDRYVSKRLESGVKKTTIHRELSDIIAVLNFAISRGRITLNPLAGYKKPKPDNERINPPSIEELNAILSHALPHLQRVILVCIYTGLRPGHSELFGLKYKDIDLTAGIITVKSAKKGGLRYREIPIHESFRRSLIEWIRVDGVNPDLHIIRYNGKPIRRGVDGAFGAAKKAAGIKRRLRLYDIRHFFATKLLTQGGDLRTVSRALGHANPTITLQVYSHTSSEILKNTIDTLPNFEINTIKKGAKVATLRAVTKRP